MTPPLPLGLAAPLAPPPVPGPLAELLEAYATVDGALLARRALLGRADTKFVLAVGALGGALRALADDHGVVLSGGARAAAYETVYFDVPGLRGYDDHVRGRTPRHKVRVRRYLDRGVAFLEVKSKTNRGTSEKSRRPHPYAEPALSGEEVAWALGITGWPGEALLPQAWTRYRRITLVGLASDERVTVDLDLRLERPTGVRCLGGLAVVEVKQPRPDPRSRGIHALRRAGARRLSISKYAVAMGLLAPGVRRNRLLPTLHEIERYGTWQSSSARIG